MEPAEVNRSSLQRPWKQACLRRPRKAYNSLWELTDAIAYGGQGCCVNTFLFHSKFLLEMLWCQVFHFWELAELQVVDNFHFPNLQGLQVKVLIVEAHDKVVQTLPIFTTCQKKTTHVYLEDMLLVPRHVVGHTAQGPA